MIPDNLHNAPKPNTGIKPVLSGSLLGEKHFITTFRCDRCGHEFEVPKLVETGGEYGGIAHKEPVSPCCEDYFEDVEDWRNVRGLCVRAELETQKLNYR